MSSPKCPSLSCLQPASSVVASLTSETSVSSTSHQNATTKSRRHEEPPINMASVSSASTVVARSSPAGRESAAANRWSSAGTVRVASSPAAVAVIKG
jgi:hypothetical protein